MERIELDKKIAKYVYENITPLKSQRKRIKKLYKELKSFLGSDRCFQTGSYARHTSIRPVNDLDVFYVFEKSTSDEEIDSSLEKLGGEIDKDFKDVCSENFEVVIQTHSVRLEFDDGFSVDVVPAVGTGDTTSDLGTPIYKVPVESTGEWVYSDPKGYKEITKNTDEASDKNFRRAVRFVKACRKSCKEVDEKFRLKSFHIEQILTESFADDPDLSLYDSIKGFFEDMPANLINARFIDRADDSIYIDAYVDELAEGERNQIINWSKNKLSQFSEIEFADEEEVHAMVGQVISCSSDDLEDNSSQTHNQSTSFSPAGPHAIR